MYYYYYYYYYYHHQTHTAKTGYARTTPVFIRFPGLLLLAALNTIQHG